MKLIAALSSIAVISAASDCCEDSAENCAERYPNGEKKQCPPPDYRSGCGDFCATPVDNPRDCSNRGSKNSQNFMPSGTAAGDTMGARIDDTAEGPMVLRNPVPYFGSTYNNAYFSSNGVISFNEGVRTFTSSPFPLSGKTMFSPFWSDFNTAIEGTWSYRQLRAGADLQTASGIVNYELDDYSDFVGTDGMIVTYDNVAHYGRSSSSDRKNTVQAIVVHDNNHSFVIFNYGDIEWTTGTASSGDSCDGLGGTPAQVGFNDGNGRYFSMPGSQTNDIQNVDDWTNCKTRGRLIFRIDGEDIQAETPAPVPDTIEPSIIDPISGVKTILGQHDIDLSAHGCQCSRMGNGGASGQGNAIDQLDRICKNWYSKRNCIQKSGGDCNPASSDSYLSHDPSNCTATANSCEAMACRVDQLFVQEVQEYMAANPGWTAVSGGACLNFVPPTTDPARPNQPKKDSCCGSSAATLVAYSSELFECVDDELHSRIPSAADCTEDETWDEASLSCSAALNELINGDTEWEANSLGYYIHVSDNTMTWDAAQTYCQGLSAGAEMAMPATAQENQVFFDNLMAKTTNFGWWGFKRFNAADTQTWNGADMRPMNWSNWCVNEPNNYMGNERCAITWSNTNPCWNDINCSDNYRAICVYYA